MKHRSNLPYILDFFTRSLPLAGICLMAMLASRFCAAENWPMFRGTDGSGITADESVPSTWSADQNLLWSVPLPGPGASSPIVWSDRVFVTCYSGYGVDRKQPGEPSELKRHLLCYDRRDGRLIWEQVIANTVTEDPYEGFITDHGYASSTPATDGEHVFAFFGKDGLFAFDWQGKEIWQAKVGSESDPARWGGGASPVLYKDLVIVNAGNEGSAVVAFRKLDGSEAWRIDDADCKNSWSTPVMAHVDGHEELIFTVPGKIFAVEPTTGRVLWNCGSPIDATVVPSAVVIGDTVLSMGSRAGEAISVRCGGSGDVSGTHVLWEQKLRAGICTPVAVAGQVYWSSMGTLLSADIKTGEPRLKERLDLGPAPSATAGGFMNRPGTVYASPVAVGNRIYLLTRSGAMLVFETTPEFKQIACNQIAEDEGSFDGTPAVSDGQLLFRSTKKLYCIAAKPWN